PPLRYFVLWRLQSVAPCQFIAIYLGRSALCPPAGFAFKSRGDALAASSSGWACPAASQPSARQGNRSRHSARTAQTSRRRLEKPHLRKSRGTPPAPSSSGWASPPAPHPSPTQGNHSRHSARTAQTSRRRLEKAHLRRLRGKPTSRGWPFRPRRISVKPSQYVPAR